MKEVTIFVSNEIYENGVKIFLNYSFMAQSKYV